MTKSLTWEEAVNNNYQRVVDVLRTTYGREFVSTNEVINLAKALFGVQERWFHVFTVEFQADPDKLPKLFQRLHYHMEQSDYEYVIEDFEIVTIDDEMIYSLTISTPDGRYLGINPAGSMPAKDGFKDMMSGLTAENLCYNPNYPSAYNSELRDVEV